MKKMSKKNNNKGFSLVELIIVIAIMAILVGIVGSQVVPYIERSKIAKDQQVLSSLCTDAVSAFAMAAGELAPNMDYTITINATNTTVTEGTETTSKPGSAAVAQIFAELQGCSTVPTNNLIGDFKYGTQVKLESKDAAKGGSVITIDYVGATGLVEVYSGTTYGLTSKIGKITSK